MPYTDLAKQSGTVLAALAASTAVAGKNQGRQEITITNDGANIVYLQLQTVDGVLPTAVAGSGLRLAASGGSWTSNSFRGAIAARAAVADTSIVVVEL